MIKSLLTEKQNEEEIEQRRELKDAIEIKLREEAMISRVLKEKLVSKELGIEQLQSDLAASVRFQVVLQNEIQRFQNELRCLTKVQALGSSDPFKSTNLHGPIKKCGCAPRLKRHYQIAYMRHTKAYKES